MISLDEPWHWTLAARESLAHFVTPECARQALGDPGDIEGLSSFDLLQESPLNSVVLAEHLYAHVRAHNIRYAGPAYAADQRKQRIRKPNEIVNSTTGTCLDLTLLLAGHSMNYSLRPVIFLFDDHAIAGLMTSHQGVNIPGTFDDHEQIKQWCAPRPDDTSDVPLSAIIPLECVGLTQGNSADCNLSFAEAVRRGREKVAMRAPTCIFDVSSRHAKGIEPLPCSMLSRARALGAGLISAAILIVLIGLAALVLLNPDPPRMPETADGRNLVILPFEVEGNEASGVAIANDAARRFADTLGDTVGAEGEDSADWLVWGPEELATEEEFGVASTDVQEFIEDRNATVAIYGTIVELAGGRANVEVNAWLGSDADALREVGAVGAFTIFRANNVKLSEAGLIDAVFGNVAVDDGDVSSLAVSWRELLNGFADLFDASGGLALADAFEHFSSASTAAPLGSADLRDVSNLFEGGMSLLLDDFLDPTAREISRTAARQAFLRVVDRGELANGALVDRARLALSSLDLAIAACDVTQLDPIERDVATIAERVPLDSAAAFDSGEVALRAALLSNRIDHCRWGAGENLTSAAVERIDRTIEHFEGRATSQSRARAQSLVATAYFIRSEYAAPGSQQRIDDLTAAFCNARVLDQERYQESLRRENPNLIEGEECT